MTNLERLIKAHTEGTTITTLSAATEKLIEEWARESLKDEALRAEIHALARKHFGATMAKLRRPARNGRRRTRRSKR